MEASSLPAIAFTLTASNPSETKPLDLSLFFSLPIQLQTGMVREGSSSSSQTPPHTTNCSTAVDCATLCYANTSSCASWSYSNKSQSCMHTDNFTSVPPAANSATREFEAEGDSPDGAGVQGSWRVSKNGCLLLERPGTHAASGEVALCGSAESSKDGKVLQRSAVNVSFGTAASLDDLFTSFDKSGDLSGIGVEPHGLIAGASVRVAIPPASNASLTISLGWYFPYKDFMGGEIIGNRYTKVYSSAEEAASILLESSSSSTASSSKPSPPPLTTFSTGPALRPLSSAPPPPYQPG